MKIIIYMALILSISISANEKLVDVDVISAASSGKNCGGKNCWNTQVCIKGMCVEKCSKKYPNGICEKGNQCVDSKCRTECIIENEKCKLGKLCKNGICISNSCENIENGYCTAGYKCINDKCVEYLCSSDNHDGYCNYKTNCNDGKCEEDNEGCSYGKNRNKNYIIFIFLFSLIFIKRKRYILNKF